MRIVSSAVYYVPDRDMYWMRICFQNIAQPMKKSTVLACASHEYLWDISNAFDISEVRLDQWSNNVLKKWKEVGESIFREVVHYDVYAISQDGVNNGLKYLKENVVPCPHGLH